MLDLNWLALESLWLELTYFLELVGVYLYSLALVYLWLELMYSLVLVDGYLYSLALVYLLMVQWLEHLPN